jgi:hypothetical protein
MLMFEGLQSISSLLRTRAARTAAFAVLALSLAIGLQAQISDRSTLTGKVLCGYQGWFACPGDGNTSLGWQHWSQGGFEIGENLYNTDVWPDLTEYNSDDIFPCGPGVVLPSGKPAYLFSPRRQGVVDTHFRWMQENNLDGIYLQRFSGGLGNPGGASQQHKDAVLQNVMRSATTYGRTFCIEYDLSGTEDSLLYSKLTTDWTYLNSQFNVAAHPRYQYHNGKPVVCLWGLVHDRPYNIATAQQVISWFKNNGVFLMAGVGGDWRSQPEPWASVYRSYDSIQPWSVGAYADWGGINYWKTSIWGPDIADCNAHGILYVPVAWPRFGWDNMHDYPCGQSKFPTRGGQHFWDQFYAQKTAGATTQKIAMFDECDESTAILKMSDDVPITGCWWTSEGLPHDWYLRMADYGGKMLRGDIPLPQVDIDTGEPISLPILTTSSPDYASIVSSTVPSTMNLAQQYPVSITVQNKGETCWNSDFFKLRAVGDADPFTTTTKQAMATGTVVMPTQQYTFNFTMRAPGHNGAYLADWGMSHELVKAFPAKFMKLVTVGSGPAMQVSSAFSSSADGWTTTTWRAGTTSYGTMGYSSSAGNPSGGGLRCVGAGTSTTDGTDRCTREGGEAAKAISTAGYYGIIVGYDVKVSGLGGDYGGAGTTTGTCTVDHNIIDEQLTVYYSTNGGSTWTEVDNIQRQELKGTYSTYGTRYIDLSGVPACNNNSGFRLKFRWQLNTSADIGYLDNIKVMGNLQDATPPGPVTNLVSTAGNRHVSLTWTNPSDMDLNGSMVRYRTDTYPTSSSDGALVTDKAGVSGASDGYMHIGLTNGVSYYYSIFAHDDTGLSAPAVTASGAPQGVVVDWVNEVFDNYPDGNLGGLNWAATELASAQVESTVAKGGTGKAALMDTIAVGNPVANEIAFTDKTSGYCYLSFDMAQDAAGTNGQTVAYVTVYGSGSPTEITQIQIQKNRLMAEYGPGSLAVLSASQTNLTWYNVKIGFNIDAKTMDFWLDGVPKGTGYAWKGAPGAISRIVISSDRNANLTTQKAYIDNLRFEPRPGTVAAVIDDGAWSPSTSKLHFSFDSVPLTYEYRYAIGTTSNGTQTRTWTSCGTSTDVLAAGLSLAEGQNYYVTVQCANLYGNIGSNKTSDGIKVAPGIVDINVAKSLADGSAADVKALRGKLVSDAFSGCFYIQEPNCLAGLKVVSAIAVNPGDQVDVCGVIKGSGAERYLDGAGGGVMRTTPGPGGPRPVMMSSASLGGADLNPYTPGVMGAMGPNNIGLLVTLMGTVTQRDPSGQYFYVDDGNGLLDGTQTAGVDNVGIRVKASPAFYAESSYVALTGISSCFSDAGQLKRQLLVNPAQAQTLRL